MARGDEQTFQKARLNNIIESLLLKPPPISIKLEDPPPSPGLIFPPAVTIIIDPAGKESFLPVWNPKVPLIVKYIGSEQE